MRKLFPLLAICGLFLVASLTTRADDEKDKTIKGEATCAKCSLKETKSCQSVVLVKEDGKEIKYYLKKNDVSDEYHKKAGFCDSSKMVKVKGDVTEKDDKKIIEAKEIEVVEE